MQAEIITIGDEILIGQIVDTNSAYMGKLLSKNGVQVYQITSIQDTKAHILKALETAGQQSQLVLVTGGLGPTKDDVTKEAICTFFDDHLIKNEKVLAHIEYLFEKYISSSISEMNRQQALVPSKAEILHNEFGTAPGLWLNKNNTVYVFMPGVPFETKALLNNHVIPKIQETFKRPHIVHKTVLTYGWGESTIANAIEEWENNLPADIKLAYLPSLGRVRLRLSGVSEDKTQIETRIAAEIDKLYPLIGEIMYGFEDGDSIELQLANILVEKGLTLATAESFTGGNIGKSFTANPGASKYYKGTVVSYATETKINVLGVPKALIEKHSVVSSAVAEAMAEQVKAVMQADVAIATTGNAGPEKGDADTPVGEVYIALSTPQRTFSQKFTMGNHRERVVQKSVNKAFELLYKEILNL